MKHLLTSCPADCAAPEGARNHCRLYPGLTPWPFDYAQGSASLTLGFGILFRPNGLERACSTWSFSWQNCAET